MAWISLIGKEGSVVYTCWQKGTRTANYQRALIVNIFVDATDFLNLDNSERTIFMFTSCSSFPEVYPYLS